MIGTKRNGGAAVAEDGGKTVDEKPERPKKVGLPPTRLILPEEPDTCCQVCC